MSDNKTPCLPASARKSTAFVPVVGDVICEGPGVIYVSVDPDVWRIRCQQCQKKTEHKCPLKKLKNKFKKKDDDRRRRFDSEDEDEISRTRRLKGLGLAGEDADGAAGGTGTGEMGGGPGGMGLDGDEEEEGEYGPGGMMWNDDMCHCPGRPSTKKPKPKVCLCSPYLPVNFLLEVEVTGVQKAEFKAKKRKHREKSEQ